MHATRIQITAERSGRLVSGMTKNRIAEAPNRMPKTLLIANFYNPKKVAKAYVSIGTSVTVMAKTPAGILEAA